MSSTRTEKPENLKADLVVVGGGGAGLSAAVAAAEKGAAVILLEKRRKLGGNSALAHEIFGAESQLQKQRKIDVQRDESFKVAMEYAHWRINPRIVRAFVDKSGDTVRWLEEKGVNFDIGGTGKVFLKRQFPPTAHRVASRRGGFAIIEALAKRGEELGVRSFCETGAKELMTSKEGKVAGVLAVKRGGEELSITAGSVVIATGGYGGNKKLLRKYCPYYSENIKLVGVPTMGDGLLMAMKIGAATEGLGVLHVEAACYIREEPAEIECAAMEPHTVWVNKRGERFVDEAIAFNMVFESAMAVVRQPDNICYTLFDEKIKQNLVESGSIAGWVHIRPGVPQPKLAALLQRAADRGNVKISDSWDGIAAWIGAKPEALKATIDEYNSFCDKGHDEIFVKDSRYLVALRTPPYYAVRFYPRNLGTIGGIKINHHMEVLDRADNPIPGLYAAGIDTGGWEPETYNQILAGSAFGFAINSGRIAGENAAQYALGNKRKPRK
jgi:fumarate reductase flavoprotein subunit